MARILIVDDDRDIVEAIEILLKANGYETECAYSREGAEKKAFTGNYDLLILDVMMEEADDGLVFARELKSKNIKTPIIMLTSLGKVTGMDYAAEGDILPVDVFHEKPISPQELIETVKRLLEGGK
jgi:DNA-binding response OmpR family regulator